jgi:hypothetical protein
MGPQDTAAKHWLVRSRDGAEVGPVSIDLIARGLAAGKVPSDAQISLAGSGVWSPAATVLAPATVRRELPTPRYKLTSSHPPSMPTVEAPSALHFGPPSSPIPSAPGSARYIDDDPIDIPKQGVLGWFS